MPKPKLPRSANNVAIPLVPDIVSYATTINSTLSSAQTITLNGKTGIIEVNTLSQSVFMKWGNTVAGTSTNFDEFIQANSLRHYVVPIGVTQVSFIEQAASATIVVIEK